MHLVWIIPAALAVIGLAVVVGLARRVADEAAGLRRELAEFSALRPALIEVRRATEQATSAARALRRPR